MHSSHNPSEIISVEYHGSLRGREDALCCAWPSQEFLSTPSFAKLESCAIDAQHKTQRLNIRQSTSGATVTPYGFGLTGWLTDPISFVDILLTCLPASAGRPFWTFLHGTGNQERSRARFHSWLSLGWSVWLVF